MASNKSRAACVCLIIKVQQMFQQGYKQGIDELGAEHKHKQKAS